MAPRRAKSATKRARPSRADGSTSKSGSKSGSKRRRLPADERRSSLLEAARKAFSETGDMTGTTIKVIARHAGISEGVIYRHFKSKDELFFAAIVEPLQEAVQRTVRETQALRPYHLMDDGSRHLSEEFFARMIESLEEIVPMLGLVLFGEPRQAARFYRTTFAPAVEELQRGWEEFYADVLGTEYPEEISARAIIGMCLMLALDQRLAAGPLPVKAVARELAALSYDGFWPLPEDFQVRESEEAQPHVGSAGGS